MSGYTRQSVAQIQDGEVVEAGPINDEFNALQGAFNSSSGHVHDGTTGNGPKISLTTSISGILPVANGGIAAKHNISATAAPGTSDDNVAGYGPGSTWTDVTNDEAYICLDATTATAIWHRITLLPTSDYQPLDADLTAIAALSSTGIATRTASNTWAQRTITGTSNEITVTNGDGVSGNPTLSLPSALTFTGKTITGGTITGATLTTATVSGDFSASSLDMNSNKITELGTPTNDTDAVTKEYVDDLVDAYVPIGGSIDYWGSTAPTNWAFMYGQPLSRTTYSVLFSRLGTTFGTGDGSTTFNLPDVRGRVTAGKDNMGGSSAARLNTISSTTLGAVGGAQTHTLTDAEISAHTHTFSGTTVSDGAHTHSVSASGTTASDGSHTHGVPTYNNSTGFALIGIGSGGTFNGNIATTSDGNHTHTVSVTGTAASSGAHTHGYSGTTSSVGSDDAHNNIQPTIICNKIIRVL